VQEAYEQILLGQPSYMQVLLDAEASDDFELSSIEKTTSSEQSSALTESRGE